MIIPWSSSPPKNKLLVGLPGLREQRVSVPRVVIVGVGFGGPVLIGVHVAISGNHKLFEMVHADSFH